MRFAPVKSTLCPGKFLQCFQSLKKKQSWLEIFRKQHKNYFFNFYNFVFNIFNTICICRSMQVENPRSSQSSFAYPFVMYLGILENVFFSKMSGVIFCLRQILCYRQSMKSYVLQNVQQLQLEKSRVFLNILQNAGNMYI